MSNLVLHVAVLALTLKLATGCRGHLVGSGNITSPNYPSAYPTNSRCTWTIAANPGQYISLRLLHLDTQYIYDYVTVYNESTTMEVNECSYVKRFSGSDYDQYGKTKILLVGPNATVTFVADSSISASGFQMEYTSVNTTSFTDCGGHLYGSGNITSPNFPSFYPVNSLCTWTLAANPGEHISLQILALDTEDTYDYVYIYNGAATSTDLSGCELLHQLSGDSSYLTYELSTKAIITGHTATVVFFSDNSISSSGFKLVYTSVNASFFAECGGILVGSGSITSPNYPNLYPNNSRCTWTLSAPDDYLLSLNIINVDLEYSYDYVYIYNGSASTKSYTSHSYTGQYDINYYGRLNPLIFSPNVTVVFFSDSSISSFGFNFQYESVNATPFTDCGGFLVGSGNITSPNYPSLYPNNSRCTWTISAPAGYLLSFRIINAEIEYSYDYVNIYNGSDPAQSSASNYYTGQYGGYYNSSVKPWLFSPNVTVIFFSDSSISSIGFHFQYETVNATQFTENDSSAPPGHSGCFIVMSSRVFVLALSASIVIYLEKSVCS